MPSPHNARDRHNHDSKSLARDCPPRRNETGRTLRGRILGAGTAAGWDMTCASHMVEEWFFRSNRTRPLSIHTEDLNELTRIIEARDAERVTQIEAAISDIIEGLLVIHLNLPPCPRCAEEERHG